MAVFRASAAPVAHTSETEYTQDFFALVEEGAANSAEVVVPLVLDLVAPKSVVDVGCGTGIWLKAFEDRGVRDYRGLDGDYINPAQLQIQSERFISAELTEPVALDRRFDLSLCLEVGEHLPAAAAPTLVDSLCSLSDIVLFSAALPGQGGTCHLNEQWPEYWAKLFQQRGYTAIDCIRPLIWDHPEVDFWYAQNIVMYANEIARERSPRLRDVAAGHGGMPRRLVHPKLFDRVRNEAEGLRDLHWTPGVRWCLRALATGLHQTGRRRLKRFKTFGGDSNGLSANDR